MLPWAFFIAPGVILQKTGAFQKSYFFRGSDFAIEDEFFQMNVIAKFNDAVKQLGEGWSVFVESQRWPYSNYPDSAFASMAAAWFDSERRERFQNKKINKFENIFILTLVFEEKETKIESSFFKFFKQDAFDEIGKIRQQDEQRLERFQRKAELFAGALAPYFVLFTEMTDEETLSYLNSCLENKNFNLQMPEIPIYLDSILGRKSIETGMSLKVGENHLHVISILGFPKLTIPGILYELNSLNFPYRWCTRYLAYGKKEGIKLIDSYVKYWNKKVKKFSGVISNSLNKNIDPGRDNPAAIANLGELEEAQYLVENEYISIGLVNFSLVIWSKDKEEALERTKLAMALINRLGFNCIDETVNSFQAWLSTHPGNGYSNTYKTPLASLSLAHLTPLSAVWGGKDNWHLKQPALLLTDTYSTTPFKLSLDVGDVGHTLILGPTGAGKSTLLSTMMLQWLRYENAKIVCFDKGGSSKSSCLICEGIYVPLKVDGKTLSFQPLGRIDEEMELNFCQEWIEEILIGREILITPQRQKELRRALEVLAASEKPERTLLHLSHLIQDFEIRDVLQPFVSGDRYGAIFDSDKERISLVNWTVFEMEHILEYKSIVPYVLSYIFHRLEESFLGDPTLLVLDEAWIFLDSPQFQAKIREWLKVLRKKNVYVIFASQSISDVLNSQIASVVIESCLTRILLPNQRAKEPISRSYYEKLGLSTKEIEILSMLTPKQDYFYSSPHGTRVFQLGLTEEDLLFVGASSPEKLQLINRLEEQRSEKAFVYKYLEALGQKDLYNSIKEFEKNEEN